jgi:hypothetical protein
MLTVGFAPTLEDIRMVQVIQAQEITLDQLTELFSLTITYKDQFFTEWLDNLPELTDYRETTARPS